MKKTAKSSRWAWCRKKMHPAETFHLKDKHRHQGICLLTGNPKFNTQLYQGSLQICCNLKCHLPIKRDQWNYPGWKWLKMQQKLKKLRGCLMRMPRGKEIKKWSSLDLGLKSLLLWRTSWRLHLQTFSNSLHSCMAGINSHNVFSNNKQCQNYKWQKPSIATQITSATKTTSTKAPKKGRGRRCQLRASSLSVNLNMTTMTHLINKGTCISEATEWPSNHRLFLKGIRVSKWWRAISITSMNRTCWATDQAQGSEEVQIELSCNNLNMRGQRKILGRWLLTCIMRH